MELLGITAELTELLFVHKDVAPAPDALAAFGQAVGLSVSTAPAPPRICQEKTGRLAPPVIVERRLHRRQQQSVTLIGAGVILVLMALLGAFAGRLSCGT